MVLVTFGFLSPRFSLMLTGFPEVVAGRVTKCAAGLEADAGLSVEAGPAVEAVY